MTIPDLRTMKFEARFWKTIDKPSQLDEPASKIDMWLICDSETGEGLVSLGVPHGRDDIVKFIIRCCAAGQLVLKECGITNIDDFNP